MSKVHEKPNQGLLRGDQGVLSTESPECVQHGMGGSTLRNLGTLINGLSVTLLELEVVVVWILDLKLWPHPQVIKSFL